MNKLAILMIGCAGLLGLDACSSGSRHLLPAATAESSTETSDSVPGGSADEITAPHESTAATAGDDDTVGGTEFTLPPGLTLPPVVTLPDLSDVTVPDVSLPPLDVDCAYFSRVFGQVFTGAVPELGDLKDQLQKLKDKLPEEYSGDVDAITDGLVTLQGVYAKYGNDYSKIVTDPATLAVYSDPAFTEGISNLETYFAANCGT